jgi:Response regulator containing CheY-like receiver and SARP domains
MIDKVKNEVYNLRQQSGNELQITCFGKLEVWIDKIPVKWERAKAEELFAFLLMNHKQFISKETIIDNLWPEYEQQKALQILQTAVCKIRNIFSSLDSKVVVQYNQSKYCLIIKETNCDLFWMEKLIYCLKNNDDDVVISDLDHVTELCKKGFLTQNGYLWSFEVDERFKQELISVLNRMRIQGQEKPCGYRMKILRYLAELQPYADAINFQLLQVYKKNGRESEARKHFLWLEKVLLEQYDTEPSKRIRDLFSN